MLQRSFVIGVKHEHRRIMGGHPAELGEPGVPQL